jgi:hypothetical protein
MVWFVERALVMLDLAALLDQAGDSVGAFDGLAVHRDLPV